MFEKELVLKTAFNSYIDALVDFVEETATATGNTQPSDMAPCTAYLLDQDYPLTLDQASVTLVRAANTDRLTARKKA